MKFLFLIPAFFAVAVPCVAETFSYDHESVPLVLKAVGPNLAGAFMADERLVVVVSGDEANQLRLRPKAESHRVTVRAGGSSERYSARSSYGRGRLFGGLRLLGRLRGGRAGG